MLPIACSHLCTLASCEILCNTQECTALHHLQQQCSGCYRLARLGMLLILQRWNAGIVLSVAPLMGADPTIDPSHKRWLHIHVRPPVRGLLKVILIRHSP